MIEVVQLLQSDGLIADIPVTVTATIIDGAATVVTRGFPDCGTWQYQRAAEEICKEVGACPDGAF